MFDSDSDSDSVSVSDFDSDYYTSVLHALIGARSSRET